ERCGPDYRRSPARRTELVRRAAVNGDREGHSCERNMEPRGSGMATAYSMRSVSMETAQAPAIDTIEPNATRKPNTSWWGLSRYAKRNRKTNESCKRGTTSMMGATARAE